MHFKDKQELYQFLANLQGAICVYHREGQPGPSGFCDCKYGANNLAKGTESGNGCPEMRNVLALINIMTDKEFERLCKRLAKTMKRNAKKAMKDPKVQEMFESLKKPRIKA
jgi:hypothetical protein